MKIAIASTNKHKIDEIKAKTASMEGISIISARDICEYEDIEETGVTFEENALIKAREIVRCSGLPALADDSGIVIDALDGEPGIHSARYGSLDSDVKRYELILSKMKEIPDERRTARFVCVMALVLPDGREFLERGVCEGTITKSPCGNLGFGYDPIFYLSDAGCTMAELSIEEKNRISHRGIALDKMGRRISELFGGIA
jgi:XTP/dITP diphosphohydrolase